MSSPVAGYAIGVGLAFLAVVGIPLRFAFPELGAFLSYAGSFLLGVLVGGVYARRLRPDEGT
ncbi:MAG: hypothetical protein WD273_08500 [Trueperaceae bacterium]